MYIGELARRVGIATSAIRYYETAGILPRAVRKSGRRIYGEDAVIRLELVQKVQAAGFTLRETRELLQASDREGWRPDNFDTIVEQKISQIDSRLKELFRMRELLNATKSCLCHGPEDCSLFAQSFVARD